jgi:hypothetical protein
MKLETLGVSPSAINWFRSYLTDQYQLVRIGECRSESKRITHGIPQGSILGPLLFNLYINEISNICSNCDIESYVDDSKLSLSFAIKDLSESMGKLDADLKSVAAWYCSNNLQINPDKIKFLLFGSRQALAKVDVPPIQFLGKELTPVPFAKDLGITLDSCLTFNEHTTNLTSKLMGSLCQISRVKHLFDKSTLIMIINSLIFGKLYYCSCVWAGTYKQNIDKLLLVQNFAARIILGIKKFDHITPGLKELGWLSVKNMLEYRDAQMIYKIINGSAPPYLCNLFKKRCIIVTLVIVKILISQNAEQVWPKAHSGIELQKFGTIFWIR